MYAVVNIKVNIKNAIKISFIVSDLILFKFLIQIYK